MTGNSWTVAKYEYVQTVKRPGFWISTLFLPILILVLMLISGLSSAKGEELFTQLPDAIQEVIIVDDADIIASELVQSPLRMETDLEMALETSAQNTSTIVIHFPASLLESNKYEIYSLDKSLLDFSSYSALADSLMTQSALVRIGDPELATLLTQSFSPSLLTFGSQGEIVTVNASQYILPVISLVIFFISVFISAQFLLQSVSEEKENRMLENILSVITPKTLIQGKIIGLSSVAITQLLIWIVLGAGLLLVGINALDLHLPIELSQLNWQILPLNLFFILCGFLLFAAIMVGVGSMATSYKDSQGLSSVFIILSMLPFYFITILVADPNGIIARIVSYFPLTAPMVFLIRYSITSVPIWELALGSVLMIIYVIVAFKIAIKLFNIGALMYNTRPGIKDLMRLLRLRTI